MKLFLAFSSSESNEYHFYCPGCECSHWIRTRGPRPCWTISEDADRPTVRPSIHVTLPGKNCHLFIEEGKIRYLNDCHHVLAGTTVELPD